MIAASSGARVTRSRANLLNSGTAILGLTFHDSRLEWGAGKSVDNRNLGG